VPPRRLRQQQKNNTIRVIDYQKTILGTSFFSYQYTTKMVYI